MYDSFFRKLDTHTKMVKKRHAKEHKQHLKADPYYYKKQQLAAVNREKVRRCIKANAYSSHPSKLQVPTSYHKVLLTNAVYLRKYYSFCSA